MAFEEFDVVTRSETFKSQPQLPGASRGIDMPLSVAYSHYQEFAICASVVVRV